MTDFQMSYEKTLTLRYLDIHENSTNPSSVQLAKKYRVPKKINSLQGKCRLSNSDSERNIYRGVALKADLSTPLGDLRFIYGVQIDSC